MAINNHNDNDYTRRWVDEEYELLDEAKLEKEKAKMNNMKIVVVTEEDYDYDMSYKNIKATFLVPQHWKWEQEADAYKEFTSIIYKKYINNIRNLDNRYVEPVLKAEARQAYNKEAGTNSYMATKYEQMTFEEI